MSKLLAAMFVALLMVGCGDPDLDDKETLDGIIAEAIDKDKLQRRSKKGETLYHATSQQTPYTGWAKLMYDNGRVNGLLQYKDGKYVEEKEAPAPNSCADSAIVNPPKH